MYYNQKDNNAYNEYELTIKEHHRYNFYKHGRNIAPKVLEEGEDVM